MKMLRRSLRPGIAEATVAIADVLRQELCEDKDAEAHKTKVPTKSSSKPAHKIPPSLATMDQAGDDVSEDGKEIAVSRGIGMPSPTHPHQPAPPLLYDKLRHVQCGQHK
jgi:hypothetical protein